MFKRQRNKAAPLSIFISYAHEDELLRQQLEAHLSLLRRQGLVAGWHDRQITPGADWKQQIDEHLETASIILLLVSSDFLASDYCYESEMQRALQRCQRNEARVIPIILRPCDWQDTPFARLQALPHDGKPVTKWDNQDEAFQDITRGLRRFITDYTGPALSPVALNNRTSLLKQVREFWIDRVLESSLHQQALIALHLQDQPNALDNSFRLQVQETKTNRPSRLLPAGTPIVDVYDKADRGLLILGKPGVGKTTLLLELARILLERAEDDQSQRMPVYFHLSSWAEKRLPLSEWLIEELRTKYKISRTIGKAWVNTDQILPLLDGLDEVAEPARPNCVQAINTYCEQHQDKGPIPIVVSCRHKDYLALPIRVELSRAVSIRPLTSGQIRDYLQSSGNQLEALRQALQADRKLCTLARYPLILSILTLAYQGATSTDLPTREAHETKLCQVFDTYVERMLTRRGVLRHGTPQQFKHWLAFLAAQMQQRQQTDFYVEYLQPAWLPKRYQLFYRWSTGCISGLASGLAFALLGGPYLGVFGAVVFGLLGGLRTRIALTEVRRWSWTNFRKGLSTKLGGGLALGLVLGLIFFVYGLFKGLAVGLFGGLILGLASILAGLFTGLSLGLVYGLIAALIEGFILEQLPPRAHTVPNEGVRRSAQNGLFLGVFFGSFTCLYVLLSLRLDSSQHVILNQIVAVVLLSGLVIGLGAALLSGLLAAMHHYILRFWLWRMRRFPWHLVAFLNEAAERLLLRKVGGGYIFVHRLLLDHFASLEKKEP